jgi:hypothetical protein
LVELLYQDEIKALAEAEPKVRKIQTDGHRHLFGPKLANTLKR